MLSASRARENTAYSRPPWLLSSVGRLVLFLTDLLLILRSHLKECKEIQESLPFVATDALDDFAYKKAGRNFCFRSFGCSRNPKQPISALRLQVARFLNMVGLLAEYLGIHSNKDLDTSVFRNGRKPKLKPCLENCRYWRYWHDRHVSHVGQMRPCKATCGRTTDSTFFTGPLLRRLSFSLASASQSNLSRLVPEALVADPAVFPNGL